MNEIIHQCLPEVLSFLKEVAVGYVVYRIGKNETMSPSSQQTREPRKYLYHNAQKPSPQCP